MGWLPWWASGMEGKTCQKESMKFIGAEKEILAGISIWENDQCADFFNLAPNFWTYFPLIRH